MTFLLLYRLSPNDQEYEYQKLKTEFKFKLIQKMSPHLTLYLLNPNRKLRLNTQYSRTSLSRKS